MTTPLLRGAVGNDPCEAQSSGRRPDLVVSGGGGGFDSIESAVIRIVATVAEKETRVRVWLASVQEGRLFHGKSRHPGVRPGSAVSALISAAVGHPAQRTSRVDLRGLVHHGLRGLQTF